MIPSIAQTFPRYQAGQTSSRSPTPPGTLSSPGLSPPRTWVQMPGASADAVHRTDTEVRYLDIHEDDQFDEAQMATWVKQAAALPGWVP